MSSPQQPVHGSLTGVGARGFYLAETLHPIKWDSSANDYVRDVVPPSDFNAPAPTAHGDNAINVVGGCKTSSLTGAETDGTIASFTMRNKTKNKRNEKKIKRQYNRGSNRPKRPLSGYNLFFRYERERLVKETLSEHGPSDTNVEGKMRNPEKTKTGKRIHRKTHGAIGFAQLGKHISEAWKGLDEKDRAPFQAEADKDKQRYQRELSAWRSAEAIGGSGNNKRGAASLEARDSPPSHAEKKSYPSRYSSEGPVRQHNGNRNIGVDEGLNPHHQSRGHYAPTDYLPPEGYGHFSNQPSFGPPHFVGPGQPRWNVSHYGQQPLNKNDHQYDDNPQQTTMQAFSPPFPTHEYHGYTGPNCPPPNSNQRHVATPAGNWALESDTAGSGEFAFQCEVCGSAVFSTFQECAEHEEVCAKIPVSVSKQGNRICGNNAVNLQSYDESPSMNEVVVEEQKQAVEAVMMLKKPIELATQLTR